MQESLVGTNVETNVETDTNSDGSIDFIDPNELNDAMQNTDNKQEEEGGGGGRNYDIIDINLESWNHSFFPLEYAILFGRINAINRLIEVGANVCRRKIVKNISTTSFNTKVLKIYYPLSLCLLTSRDSQNGLENASILIKNGAYSSQQCFLFIRKKSIL
ncbi:ankyrin repeat protein [Gigaspora margarita]|uniref:Ankyrin repeat protein n=1 Tax=Gigaspora margarita TaxID=4874 RepID=A0A8H4EP45_GIGMA|nr:ankyrin repeat protein [Gigaspora margarita]